jgi:CopG family nickel-responsive transcriptional regulator
MELKRFGVSIPAGLLEEFDRLVADKGYIGRSEAIRDAMRLFISQSDWESSQGGGFASLNIVYQHKPQLMASLLKWQHDADAEVISTVHTHITRTHCFEVLTIKGTKEGIQRLANKISGIKGIEYSKLFAFSVPDDPGHAHSH